MMTEMLKPKPGESIYDPTCGSASGSRRLRFLAAKFDKTPKVHGRTVQVVKRLDIALKSVYIFDTKTYINMGQK